MGLLTADQERKCFLYLGYLSVNRTGVFVGGQPETTEVVHKLQVSLDNLVEAKLQNVTDLLNTLDLLYAKLPSVEASFQAIQAGKITLQPREWQMRLMQYNYFRRMLGVQLDVAVDPFTEADAAGGGGMSQGPWREP
jgi:hypothetical protein